MAIDKATILQSAQRFTSQGKYNEAIAEWKKLVSASPTDGASHNAIGDLHVKRNATVDAVEAYYQAAAAFRSGGEALKAVAVYKKIIKIDANQFKAYEHLAAINAERGLVSSAVADYLSLSKLYLKANKAKDALGTYRAAIKVDPSNIEAKRQMADLCLKQSWNDEAVKAYTELGRECASQRRLDEAKEAYQAALKIAPGDRDVQHLLQGLESGAAAAPAPAGSAPTGGPAASQVDPSSLGAANRPALLGYAQEQMTGGQYSQAEAALSELLSRQPGDPEVCRLLARVHLKAGQIVLARGEIQFLAESAIRGAQDYALAESMIQEYLQVNPTCVTMLELLGKVYEQSGQVNSAADQYGRAVEILLEHPDPDNPTLPTELYEKIKEIAPSSPVVQELTQRFQAGQAAAAPAPSAPAPAQAQAAHSEQELLTRYELGVAYRDMGLLDEAMEEIQVALQGPACFVNASHIMALCLKEQGKAKEAIKYLEQALADAGCVGDLATTIRYDLGLLYEAEGEFEKAFKTFSMIPAYKDVPKRLEWSKNGGQKAARR